jgi:hypothetical protein
MSDLAALDQALQPRPRQQGQMLRQHAVEPLSGIGFTGPDHDGVIGSQHLPLAGLGPATHVFKPADRKDRPNQGSLDGSGELPGTRPVLYVHLTLFCGKNI